MRPPGVRRPGALGPWVVLPRPNPGARLRLFCFPYGGGGAAVFTAWPEGLPDEVEVCAVQPPGREGRLSEAPFTDVHALVEALHPALRPHLDRPFALFGHSNGAVMAFELARALRRAGGPMPVRLIASGRPAPQLALDEPPVHALDDEAFTREVRRFSGTPEAVLENAELMELLMPLLRADFQLGETYVARDEPPLPVPITAVGGVDDHEVRREQVEAWREQTSRDFRLAMLPGGHFFLQDQRDLLLREIAADLRRDLPALAR